MLHVQDPTVVNLSTVEFPFVEDDGVQGAAVAGSINTIDVKVRRTPISAIEVLLIIYTV
jgi:hypothetical protein